MSDLRELSLRLNAVLEMVGVTDEMRRYHRRRATMREILAIFRAKRHSGELIHVYQCGSSWEGTVTPDLASDIDIIVCPSWEGTVTPDLASDIDIIVCPSEPLFVPHRLTAGPDWFLQVVRDEWTRPGYVKLQCVMDGRSLTNYDVAESDSASFDGEGRACLKHIPTNVTGGTNHGPASMFVNEEGRHFLDTVHAYQCKGIPQFATDWITRPRQYDWPSQQLIDQLKMMGCIFVGVGHYESREREIEWRLSFSLQERALMKSLNIIQHRVYVLLKIIKKNIFEKRLNQESLSSYHCKTCVFYMVESTPESMWVAENIIDCLLQCLTLLLRWINDKFCPNFFLPNSNLFDKEVFLRLADPLERLIASLLQIGHPFLYLLQSDHVGEMLRSEELVLFKAVASYSINKYVVNIDESLINHIIIVFCPTKIPNDPNLDTLSLYMTEIEKCQNGEILPGYTEEEYRTVLRYFLPWLHLSIGLEFSARAVMYPDRHDGNELIRKANKHLQQARNTDLVNGRLAQATILLRSDNLDECLLLLKELENCWTYRIVTCCPCRGRNRMVYHDEKQVWAVAAEYRHMSLRKHMRTRYASCVIFERSQIELVPPPLRYEMYRSLYTRPGSRDKIKDVWFDLAAVDGKVYLYLLQYIVCSKLNMEPYKQIAIDNLASITLNDIDKVLNHRETAFNLLGWVYLQEHRVYDAERCFRQSWQIRPDHNAAKFHVLNLLCRLSEARAHLPNDA